MSIDEYIDDMSRFPRDKLLAYVYGPCDRRVIVMKPSLYFMLVIRPWNFVCTPFNKLLRWIGDHMPLYDFEGNPMNDKWIHFSVMLKMAGVIPMQDYGWHVVDVQPISEMTPKKVNRYFKSRCNATDGKRRS